MKQSSSIDTQMSQYLSFVSCGFFFARYLPHQRKNKWDSYVMLSFHQGGLGVLYAELCETERKMNQANPGMKSCYSDIARRIKESCASFTNLLAAVKIHLPKPPPKARKPKAKG